MTDAGSSQQMEAYAQVLRYQQGAPVKVDNIKVTSGKASTVIPTPDPTPTPKPEDSHLVLNGEFDEGDKNWKLSGGTIIEMDMQYLLLVQIQMDYHRRLV